VAAAAGVAAGAALLGRGEVQLATAALAVVLLIAYSWRPAALAIALAAVMAVGTAVVPEAVLYRDRSFFGTYAVLEAADGTRLLQMGTTVHGSQRPDRAGQPTTYYHPDGPLGDLFAGDREPLAAGLIGLGAGEIAAYGRPGDHFAYYEIDPVVVRIAQDPALFTYLRDTRAEVEVVVGDGRLALAASADRYDVVVVDAFSSDAIPVHLLTEEALTTYLAHVGEQGLVVLHVSNRHFELAPVVGRLAAELGVSAAGQRYQPDAAAVATGATPSTWVALSASAAAIAALGSGWEPVAPSGPRWTDDYSNVLGVFDL
jgi:spermidine synthase